MEKFTPLLTTTDWNEEWKSLQVSRKRADSAAYWDERAATFSRRDKPNAYVTGFIDNMGLQPGDVIFDMGCGNGALTLPLAQRGHRVISADFSRGMLNALIEDATRLGVIDLITPIQMSWADPWEDFGVDAKCADIAIASRSIATENLSDSLMRLDAVARRRVCATMTTSYSPRVDERILMDLGLQSHFGRDFIYAFNILVGLGIHPSISYMPNDRHDAFESKEAALESFSRMRGDILRIVPESEQEELGARFDAWLASDLTQDADEAGNPFWRLSQPRRTSWAFISWDPR